MPRDFIESNVLRGEARCCRQGDAMIDPVREVDGPLQRLHTPQAASNDGRPAADAKVLGKLFLASYPISHLWLWELSSPGVARVRVGRVGSR